MQDQLSLFQRKTFPVTSVQSTPPPSPTATSFLFSVLPNYFLYLQAKGYSSYTPGDFTADVKKFGTYISNKVLAEITTNDIRDWLQALRTRERMSEKSISRKRSALNNFFSWLVIESVLDSNPMAPIPNTKVIPPLPEILFEAECTKLKEAVSTDPRMYLLVLLLLETGIKTEELLALQLFHIDTSNKYAPEVWIKHRGKKVRKDRKLKLPREIIPVLKDYVATYTITGTLFPYTHRYISKLLSGARERAGIQKPLSAHLLRNTCAVRQIKSGEPIERVLLKLGLAETTWEEAKEKYLKLTSSAL